MSAPSSRFHFMAPGQFRPRVEIHVLTQQSLIAAFFTMAVFTGLVGDQGWPELASATWVAAYHVFHAWYILARRIRGSPIWSVELATPVLDVLCITIGWIALGEPDSPVWAIYLYALVSYARRYFGWRYLALAGYIIANLAIGRLMTSAIAGTPLFDFGLLMMTLLGGALAANAHAVGIGWRKAQSSALHLADTDPLTGIANRRRLLRDLDAMAAEPGHVFTLLMLDLDDFKRLNDEYGHLYGDGVLQNVAQVLSGSIRTGDRVARYGGEEFVVALPGTGQQEASFIADRLRRQIASSTVTTVSVGCAVREAGEPAADVLKRADDVLLLAKRTGKDRVHWSSMRKSA